MDHIDKRLAMDGLNMRYNVAMNASLGITKKTLNRYYDMTDALEVNNIALLWVSNYYLILYPHIQNSQWLLWISFWQAHIILQ